jgi:hypothetical protein
MRGQDPGLPPGVRTSDIPSNRPQDEEIDVQIVITEGERRELAEALEYGTLLRGFPHSILERLLEAANDERR